MQDQPSVVPDAFNPPPAPAPAPAVSHEHSAPWSAVHFAPPADWVSAEDYDGTISGRGGDHLTYLLWARQELAGTGRTFHSISMRLETSLAVQHESQWSVQLDPRRQSLTVHWLRVVRDGIVIDHLHRDRLRLIQRETQLERLIIDGTWTLVSVLEDVRPGDVIESAYSFHSTHPVRPGSSETFFVVPPQTIVGRYRLTILSEPSVGDLQWKASDDAAKLIENIDSAGRRRWVWEGEQLVLREPEANQPGSFLDYIWIQVSNLSDWRILATCVAASWAHHGDITGSETIPEFIRPEVVDEAAVVKLVQHIQDHFRYLSVNIELGGWTPSAPSIVTRRRYGDCKDLAWLASRILTSWGVDARPVLVGAGLREQTAVLLPMALLFNHAVLEVEMAGRSRWFDLTDRSQGGNFDTQAVAWFGYGLPLYADSPGLRAQPGEQAPSVYAIDETILLDTRQMQVSMVEQRVRVEGIHADILRNERQHAGADQWVKDRLQQAANRYGKATRVGNLLWRDDRVANVCEVVEVFEVSDSLFIDEYTRQATFVVPPNIILQSFAVPLAQPRRTDWAMPFPLSIRHRITVKAAGMNASPARRRKWVEHGFSGSIDEPKMAGSWSKVVQFNVSRSRIAPDKIAEYRKEIERFLTETSWRLIVPAGHPRARRYKGFGELGDEAVSPVSAVPVKPAEITPPTPAELRERDVIPNAKLQGREQIYQRSSGRRRSSRSHRNSQVEIPAWLWRGVGIAGAAGLIALVRACADAAL